VKLPGRAEDRGKKGEKKRGGWNLPVEKGLETVLKKIGGGGGAKDTKSRAGREKRAHETAIY